jgi:hypothetical protein
MLLDKLSLEPGEEVLKVVRKHWFIITAELIGAVMTAIVPLILLGVFLELPKAFEVSGITTEGHAPILTFAAATWLLLSTMSAFVVWTHYYLDLWVITDRRIISVEQIHFFNRNVAIFRLERMQDIEFSVKGLLQTFFNFGTLSAQTAGHSELNNKPNLSKSVEASGE